MLCHRAVRCTFTRCCFQMRIGTLGKQFTVPELRGALESVGFANETVRNTTHYFRCCRPPDSYAASGRETPAVQYWTGVAKEILPGGELVDQ